MGRYHFTDKAFRPYVAVGAGALKHRNIMDEGTDASLSVGFG